MTRLLYGAGIIALLATSCGGNQSPQMQALKSKEELLKLNTELTQLQIQKEKQTSVVAKLQADTNALNATADSQTTSFSASDNNASAAAKDAKKTAQLLEKTQKANDKLAKEQRKLDKINGDIAKIQSKLDKLNKEIEVVDKAQ